MDIARLSTALSSANLQTNVGLAVLGKQLELNESVGAGLVKMMDSAAAMELAVNPHIGSNIDISV